MTLAFESCLLLLEIFKVEVLEILRQLAFYTTIGKPETNNTIRIYRNKATNREISV
jgi:hypothetical protein